MKRTGLLTLALLSLLLYTAKTADAGESAVDAYVTTLALNLRSGPGVHNRAIGTLLEYDPVQITDRKHVGKTTWYAVEAAGGYMNGWVSGDYLAFGEPPIGFTPDVDYGAKETPTLVKGPFKYLGVAGCKKCHIKSTGKFPEGAYTVWHSALHASAFRSLQRAYTKVIAKRRRDVDDPATDWRCVKCHQAAYGADPSQLSPTYRPEDGVTCEVCHGPGSAYANVDHGPSNPERYKLGFMKLVDLDEREALCTRCHNPASPTYKPFNLQVFSEAILHWVDPNDAAYRQFAKRASRRREQMVAQKRAAAAAAPATAPPQMPPTPAVVAEQPTAAQHTPTATAAKLPTPTATVAATAMMPEKKAPPATAAPAKTAVPPTATSAPQTATSAPQTATSAPHTATSAPHTPTPTRTSAPVATPAKDQSAERTKTAIAQQAQEAAAAAELKRQKEAEAAERERQEKEAAAAQAAAKQATGLEKYLVGLPKVFTLNKDGKKYLTVRFTHGAHSSKDYVPGISCQTCHHTQEGDKKPEKCIKCHDIGGEADETKAKTRAVHDKEASFPKEKGQEGVSCRGCHMAQNALLEDGKRSGKEAPTKCTGCHKRK